MSTIPHDLYSLFSYVVMFVLLSTLFVQVREIRRGRRP